MAVRFVSVDEIRAYSGISSDLINDADITEMIEDIEYQVEKYLNCDLTPVVRIESRDGNRKFNMFTDRSPLLSLRALTINDQVIDITSVKFHKTGKIEFLNSANTSNVRGFTGLQNKVFIKYVHGRVEYDKLVNTETTADSIVGTSIVLAVSSETGFLLDDWIEVSSFDGNTEYAQVTSTGANSITVDELSLTHLSGATVKRSQINLTIKRLIKLWVAIMAINRAVGQSFDEIVGYTMGEFQVQKGEPFTQFRESIIRFENQARDLMNSLRPTPGIMV